LHKSLTKAVKVGSGWDKMLDIVCVMYAAHNRMTMMMMEAFVGGNFNWAKTMKGFLLIEHKITQ
jgi:hypothetical protein